MNTGTTTCYREKPIRLQSRKKKFMRELSL